MASEICLFLHRKSANEPAIKEAVKHVRGKGIRVRDIRSKAHELQCSTRLGDQSQ
jgi:hypothetical protein